MFPYEDSKIVSVCPYPEKGNHPCFVNISPTLVIDTSMERSSRVLHHGNQFFFYAYLSISAVMFCQFSAYAVYIDDTSINIHVGLNIYFCIKLLAIGACSY